MTPDTHVFAAALQAYADAVDLQFEKAAAAFTDEERGFQIDGAVDRGLVNMSARVSQMLKFWLMHP